MSHSDNWSDYYFIHQQKNKIAEKGIEQREKATEAQLKAQQYENQLNRENALQKEKMRIVAEQHKQHQQERALLETAKIEASTYLEAQHNQFFYDFIKNEQLHQLKAEEKQGNFIWDSLGSFRDFALEQAKAQALFNQERWSKTKDIENQQTLQANQLTYELEKQNREHTQTLAIHEEQRKTYISNVEADTNAYAQRAGIDLKSYEVRSLIDDNSYTQRSIRDSQAYAERTLIDTNAYNQRSIIDSIAYKEKAKVDTNAIAERAVIDRETKMAEVLCYFYKVAIDAKWKVWVMQQEQKLFGRKVTDEELNEFVKQNRKKWDAEIE